MFARAREQLSNAVDQAAQVTRRRGTRRRLRRNAAVSSTPDDDDDDHHQPASSFDDTASVRSQITVETTRTASNENKKQILGSEDVASSSHISRVFVKPSDDPSLDPLEILEAAQSDITKLSVYLQQINVNKSIAGAAISLIRGDDRTWESIAADMLRHKARWECITLEDCQGEYLDTLLTNLWHIDKCETIHLSNIVLTQHAAWSFQAMQFCKGITKLQLDLIDLSFAMPLLCRGLKQNTSMKALIASRCGLDDDRLHELFQNLPSQLEELRIFGNKCREKGLVAITSVVHHSQHLKILDMSYQHVQVNNPEDGEFDVSWLAGALHSNKVLKVLDLDNDGIDDGHLTHLCAALVNNETLEEVMLNHNCITANGIAILSSRFHEMKGLKKISMYSNLFDAPQVDAMVAQNLTPTPRVIVPTGNQNGDSDSVTSEIEDEFNENIDYDEETVGENEQVIGASDDGDNDDEDDGDYMDDDSSAPPLSVDFRDPGEISGDSVSDDVDDESEEIIDYSEDENDGDEDEDSSNSTPARNDEIDLQESTEGELISPYGNENGDVSLQVTTASVANCGDDETATSATEPQILSITSDTTITHPNEASECSTIDNIPSSLKENCDHDNDDLQPSSSKVTPEDESGFDVNNITASTRTLASEIVTNGYKEIETDGLGEKTNGTDDMRTDVQDQMLPSNDDDYVGESSKPFSCDNGDEAPMIEMDNKAPDGETITDKQFIQEHCSTSPAEKEKADSSKALNGLNTKELIEEPPLPEKNQVELVPSISKGDEADSTTVPEPDSRPLVPVSTIATTLNPKSNESNKEAENQNEFSTENSELDVVAETEADAANVSEPVFEATGESSIDDSPLEMGSEPEDCKSKSSIALNVSKNKNMGALAHLLSVSKLFQVLSDDRSGPFTLFAPTDVAFQGAVDDLGISLSELEDDNDALDDILNYHVVAREIQISQYETPKLNIDTLQGSEIDITGMNLNSETKIVGSGIKATNGVIYAIDTVLLPPTEDESDSENDSE